MDRHITLNDGKRALVSEADFDVLSRHRWNCTETYPGKFYAMRHQHRYMCPETGKQRHRTVYMHRVILDAAAGQIVDHINGDGLDNRRENLRLATASQNCSNRRSYAPRSGFRGVYAVGRKWLAMITVRGVNTRLGRFDKPEDAARAYDAKAREHFGEFATLNFGDA